MCVVWCLVSLPSSPLAYISCTSQHAVSVCVCVCCYVVDSKTRYKIVSGIGSWLASWACFISGPEKTFENYGQSHAKFKQEVVAKFIISRIKHNSLMISTPEGNTTYIHTQPHLRLWNFSNCLIAIAEEFAKYY